jgi:hypothetical protein
MFHRLQTTDHRFDTRAHLLVAVEQGSLLGRERLLPLTQRTILFLELCDRYQQFIDATLEALELQIDRGGYFCFCHMKTIVRSYRCGQ